MLAAVGSVALVLGPLAERPGEAPVRADGRCTYLLTDGHDEHGRRIAVARWD
ncbi:hypothetical protein ACFRCI_43925 [Streptomyces sp. NPDC056638]|uniref:hypothetical protein n=1 Tax=Streptomyces sp. NPDC056638 TaxID=3345887 RepID=UPI00367FF2BB